MRESVQEQARMLRVPVRPRVTCTVRRNKGGPHRAPARETRMKSSIRSPTQTFWRLRSEAWGLRRHPSCFGNAILRNDNDELFDGPFLPKLFSDHRGPLPDRNARKEAELLRGPAETGSCSSGNYYEGPGLLAHVYGRILPKTILPAEVCSMEVTVTFTLSPILL